MQNLNYKVVALCRTIFKENRVCVQSALKSQLFEGDFMLILSTFLTHKKGWHDPVTEF